MSVAKVLSEKVGRESRSPEHEQLGVGVTDYTATQEKCEDGVDVGVVAWEFEVSCGHSVVPDPRVRCGLQKSPAARIFVREGSECDGKDG